MTYFKRRRGILDEIRIMDPRVLQAAIDHPRWWQTQRALVAERETVVDLSAHAIGECENPLAKAGIRIFRAEQEGAFKARIAEEYGIRGLALNGLCELRLPTKVDQIDILIAHFGRPPTVKAYSGDREEVSRVADDRPRQVELMRLMGHGLDRVTIETHDGASLVQIAFPGHSRGQLSGRPKQSRKLATKKK